MFGKKTDKLSDASIDSTVSVETIPGAFYGGNDPVIYQNQEPVQVKTVVQPPSVPPSVLPPVPPKPLVPPTTQGITRVQPKGHRTLFILAGVLLVVIGGGAWWFFTADESQIVFQGPETAPTFTEPAPVSQDPVLDSVIDETVTTTPEVIENPASLGVVPIDFPRVLLANNSDTDSDSLTDNEEELFGTDSGVSDSDADGYYDGQELFNLYNPKGFAPVKLIDSGLVKEYVNPTWQYRIYYPASWELGTVDQKNDQVLISALGGDYIEIRAMQKNGQETFFDWFGRVASQEFITDVQQSKNRFEESVWIRKDSLVGFVDHAGVVFVILYHPNAEGPISYRHTMEMMLQSFRPSKTSVILPEQTILPKPLTEEPSTEANSFASTTINTAQ